MLLVVATGCGPRSVASGSPEPLPTPVITPDPHLKAPVTADQVYLAIASGQMAIYPNNATESGPIVKRINADLDGWPIRITAYSSAAALAKATPWKAGQTPGRGDAPYNFLALNIEVEYGPLSAVATLEAPDATHQATAAKLITILDPLLWPIEQHSVTAIPSRTVLAPSASPAPSKAVKSAPPKKSAAPAKSKAP
jgi:hypothetical protein